MQKRLCRPWLWAVPVIALLSAPAGAEEAAPQPELVLPQKLPEKLEADLRATSVFLKPLSPIPSGNLALRRE